MTIQICKIILPPQQQNNLPSGGQTPPLRFVKLYTLNSPLVSNLSKETKAGDGAAEAYRTARGAENLVGVYRDVAFVLGVAFVVGV